MSYQNSPPNSPPNSPETLGQVDLLAPPFKGHLHPILAMAKIIQEAGFKVRIISTPSAKEEIERSGMLCHILQGIDDKSLIEKVNPPYAIGHSVIKLERQFSRVLFFMEEVHRALDQLYKASRPQLIIADFTVVPGGIIADKYQIPWWTSLPSACVLECGDGPPAYLGGWRPSKNILCLWRDYIGRKLVRFFKRAVFFLYRRRIRALGLQSVYREDGSEAIYSKDKILCLASRNIEFAVKWPQAAQFVGPQLYSSATPNPPPDFSSEKLFVLVTMGTHLDWSKTGLWQRILDLSKKFPELEFHFSCGGALLELHENISNCKAYRYIDYQYITRYSLVIHHGGAGIMYHCLNHNIPAVVLPQDYDQFDHAARLEAFGAAIHLKNANGLEGAIQSALKLKFNYIEDVDCSLLQALSNFSTSSTS